MKTKDEIRLAFSEAKEGEPILSNDIKKGDYIVETNGWCGEMIDNQRGNIRMANIHGTFEECGSIYVWDIDKVCQKGVSRKLQLTDKQQRAREIAESMGF